MKKQVVIFVKILVVLSTKRLFEGVDQMNEDDERIRRFLDRNIGKMVTIAVPHMILPQGLFFYTGEISSINQEYVMLETDKGFKKIIITDIQEVRLKGG